MYSKLCRIHGKLGLMNIHEPEVAGEIVTEPLISATLGGQWVWSPTSDDVNVFQSSEEVLGHGESSEQVNVCS